MRTTGKYLAALLPILFVAIAANAQWLRQTVDTKASFRGLDVVSEKVIWASGTSGTVVLTADGGNSWKVVAVPGAEKLDFRDIEAFDSKTAYVLSIGNGESSRIYKTVDGGATWQLQFTNNDPKAFYDAIACWNKRKCMAMSDPVDGRYRLISTEDGRTWKVLPVDQSPQAEPGEAAFAASGTCLIVRGNSDYYLVSGGSNARVFQSEYRSTAWVVPQPPMAKGTPGSGIFSLAMRDKKNGIVVGGNYEKPDERARTGAVTKTGGMTWEAVTGLGGYRSGVTYVDKKTIVAVGTNGSDISDDGGKTWRSLGNENLNVVAAGQKRTVWAAGPNGYIGRIYLGEVTLD
ncbi:MAG: hypothetical protein QUS14_09950 [Pyrinomonadaceae bacterium]|nr:hypothetical protein [Pyrinomonadaceae bacterium]